MDKGTKGICFGCQTELSGEEVLPHLEDCKAIDGTGLGYLVKVSSKEKRNSWMLLAISREATFNTLDQFLREAWFGSTGHLSLFTIGDRHFSSHAKGDFDQAPIDTKVGGMFIPGLSFDYLYDFENSTHLHFEVLHEWNRCTPLKVIPLVQGASTKMSCSGCRGVGDLSCDVCFGSVCSACQKGHICREKPSKPLQSSPKASSTRRIES